MKNKNYHNWKQWESSRINRNRIIVAVHIATIIAVFAFAAIIELTQVNNITAQ